MHVSNTDTKGRNQDQTRQEGQGRIQRLPPMLMTAKQQEPNEKTKAMEQNRQCALFPITHTSGVYVDWAEQELTVQRIMLVV
mmetsp:Transcript_135148/g.263219  ORF Transcript_135148/g.263219 Transcript_135148/m.263219 type:complete len:82 (+) Transcript_135148:134-379(+)